ncbi:MAG: chemotaxis protein CheD [Sandaracinaceae bacterium]
MPRRGPKPALIPAHPAPPKPRLERPSHDLKVAVGVGDVKFARANHYLVTYGLGSCIAICAYSPSQRIAGMLHFMLPDSSKGSSNARATRPAVFADTGMRMLLEGLHKYGVAIRGLRVKLVGGAAVSNLKMDIGARNILAAKKLLWREKVPVDAEAVGGNLARTVRLSTDGKCLVHSPSKGDLWL